MVPVMATAAVAPSTVSNSRWPKPRGLPVSRSVAMRTEVMLPQDSKVERSSSSVTWKDRLPMKTVLEGSAAEAPAVEGGEKEKRVEAVGEQKRGRSHAIGRHSQSSPQPQAAPRGNAPAPPAARGARGWATSTDTERPL